MYAPSYREDRVVAFDYDNTITRDEKHNRHRHRATEVQKTMGSVGRLEKIRQLFSGLHANNVKIIIVTFNEEKHVRRVLGDFGLMCFVSGIYDHDFIFDFVSKVQIGIGREEKLRLAKQIFMMYYVGPKFITNINTQTMMLVDDQASNLDHGLSTFCSTVHVDAIREGYGVNDREIAIISRLFGIIHPLHAPICPYSREFVR